MKGRKEGNTRACQGREKAERKEEKKEEKRMRK